MERLRQDLKHGLRMLRRTPGFTLVALVVFALGIGANAAIFSIVHAVLLQPLPYPDASRLVRVWHTPPQSGFPGVKTFAVSNANYLDWEAQNHVFEKMALIGGAVLSASLMVPSPARLRPLFPAGRGAGRAGRARPAARRRGNYRRSR